MQENSPSLTPKNHDGVRTTRFKIEKKARVNSYKFRGENIHVWELSFRRFWSRHVCPGYPYDLSVQGQTADGLVQAPI